MRLSCLLVPLATLLLPVLAHAEGDSIAQAKSLNANTPGFGAALMGSTEKSKNRQVLEGVFLGIEAGDYFHWNMKTASGEERSFFMLKPDASVDKVAANPKRFVGKRCRVTWKKSKENIPEAGGSQELEQILSVEWL